MADTRRAALEPEATLTARDYFQVLWRHKAIILILTVAAAGSGFVGSKWFLKPTYSATATMLEFTPSTPVLNPNAFAFVETLGQTYATLATSQSVLERAVRTYSLPVSAAALATTVQATPVTNTNLLSLTATASSGSEAAAIANGVARSLSREVSGMGQGIRLLDPATPPALPSGPKTGMNTGIAGVVGFLVGVALSFLLEYLDDSVKAEEEVAELAGVAVLGEIPFISTRDMAVVPPSAQPITAGKEVEKWPKEPTKVSST